MSYKLLTAFDSPSTAAQGLLPEAAHPLMTEDASSVLGDFYYECPTCKHLQDALKAAIRVQVGVVGKAEQERWDSRVG